MKHILAMIGAAFYFALIIGFLLVFFTIYKAKGAERHSDERAGQYTCDDVRWAKENLSPQVIEAIKGRMTKTQLQKAFACLATKGNYENSRRVYYPVRDIAE